MSKSFEDIMARHDGESREGDTTEGAAGTKDEAEIRAVLDKLQAADRAFASAADELLEMPVPDRLVDAIRQSRDRSTASQEAPVEPAESPKQSAQIIPFPRRRAVVSFALAAGLAAVVATNTQLFQSPAESALGFESSAELALFQDAMDTVASGEILSSADGVTSLMPTVSFRSGTGAFCREFLALQAETEFSAVACQASAGTWELRGQQRVAGGVEDGNYQPASGANADTVLAPDLERARVLSYEDEQAAILSGWKPSGL